jgi:hypothetical protein
MPDKFKDSHDSHHSNQADNLASFAHDLKILEEKEATRLM